MRKLICALGLCAPLFSNAILVKGGATCGQWISERRSDGQAANDNSLWLLGYLSGIAVATGKDVLVNVDSASLNLWMDNYCRANPLTPGSNGASKLYLELERRKGQK